MESIGTTGVEEGTEVDMEVAVPWGAGAHAVKKKIVDSSTRLLLIRISFANIFSPLIEYGSIDEIFIHGTSGV
jgi:hypothetical protein